MILKIGFMGDSWVYRDKITAVRTQWVDSETTKGRITRLALEFENGTEEEVFYDFGTSMYLMSDSGKTIERIR